jgi:hypothetical protein
MDGMSVEKTHEEKETLKIDILLPGHDPRETTALFTHSKKLLMEREGHRCSVCGRTPEEAGPLESHHHPIERSLANMIDWNLFAKACKEGKWGPHAQAFDWASFDGDKDPYKFVDDQTVNGLLLCADHHRKNGEGIHAVPYPFFIAQMYGKEGYPFTPEEILHHEEDHV